MNDNGHPKPEFVPIDDAIRGMIGASNDALEAAARLVDGWFKGKEQELAAAIRLLKKCTDGI